MFEKLLSLVPYNPGIAHQLAFYGHRMREEASIRRLGTVFLVLAFVVQSLAVINPPVSAITNGPNDLINGGFTSPDDAYNHCMSNNSENFGAIMHYFGIKCIDLKEASTSTLDPTATRKDQDGKTVHYYSAGRNNYESTNDTTYNVPGGGTIYFRSFASVTVDHNDDWRALMVHNNAGVQFYILYKCGNLVSLGIPTPSPIAESVTVIGGSGNVPASSSNTTSPVQGNPGVQNPDNGPATPPITPDDTTGGPVVEGSTPQQVTPCKFNSNISANSENCPEECPTNTSIPITSAQCIFPCPYNGSISEDSPACKPCDKSTSIDDAIACVSIRKTAANITQNIADANNTTAKAGDIITYTLYAQNLGKENVLDFTFQENMNDVLDYAAVVDPHGGTLAADGVIAWPARDLSAESSASVQVTVKVKDPIPQTPVSTSDPSHFDMLITNVYGNSVNIKLPASVNKSVELASAQLPNTGPGTTLFIAASIMVLSGYFYSRAHLLARETDIALKESA